MGTSDTLNKNDTQQKKDHLKKKKKKKSAILKKWPLTRMVHDKYSN